MMFYDAKCDRYRWGTRAGGGCRSRSKKVSVVRWHFSRGGRNWKVVRGIFFCAEETEKQFTRPNWYRWLKFSSRRPHSIDLHKMLVDFGWTSLIFGSDVTTWLQLLSWGRNRKWIFGGKRSEGSRAFNWFRNFLDLWLLDDDSTGNCFFFWVGDFEDCEHRKAS